MLRMATATPSGYIDDLKARGISHKEVRIPSQDESNHEIVLSVRQPASKSSNPRPCIYWIHGGGFHWGDRLHILEFPTEAILECDAVCVSVEYRLAPEHSFSTAVEDCYTGFQWTNRHAKELDIDPMRLIVGGTSAGGGLAAATVLLCRDRKGPVACAQCLICPGIDDRTGTISSQQYIEDSDFLPNIAFEDIWKSCLTDNDEGSARSITTPGRVKDLSNLPTAYLDVGSAEVLRDYTVAYASRLWANGVQAELHVWAGGFHGFDMFFPDAAVSQASRKARLGWMKRVFKIARS